MSGSLNRVQLIGNLGQDPKIIPFQNGERAAQLSLATSESWTDKKTGERKDATEWHRIVVYPEPKVAFCERYLKKGMRVMIEGTLRTRKWVDEKTGQDRWTTEIVVRPRGEIMILSDRRDARAEGDGSVVPDSRGGQDNRGGRGGWEGQGRDGGRGGRAGPQGGREPEPAWQPYGGNSPDDGLPF